MDRILHAYAYLFINLNNIPIYSGEIKCWTCRTTGGKVNVRYAILWSVSLLFLSLGIIILVAIFIYCAVHLGRIFIGVCPLLNEWRQIQINWMPCVCVRARAWIANNYAADKHWCAFARRVCLSARNAHWFWYRLKWCAMVLSLFDFYWISDASTILVTWVRMILCSKQTKITSFSAPNTQIANSMNEPHLKIDESRKLK